MEQSPTPPASSRGPLAAVRVLDMSRILAGPWAGQVSPTLAPLRGAGVIWKKSA